MSETCGRHILVSQCMFIECVCVFVCLCVCVCVYVCVFRVLPNGCHRGIGHAHAMQVVRAPVGRGGYLSIMELLQHTRW